MDETHRIASSPSPHLSTEEAGAGAGVPIATLATTPVDASENLESSPKESGSRRLLVAALAVVDAAVVAAVVRCTVTCPLKSELHARLKNNMMARRRVPGNNAKGVR